MTRARHVRPRLNRKLRAGSQLDYRFCERIYGPDHKLQGIIDRSQRLFQHGGRLSTFVYWKDKLMSLSLETWQRIAAECDFIEVIDHDRNECYTVSVATAKDRGRVYSAGGQTRYGVPMDAWDRTPGPVPALPPELVTPAPAPEPPKQAGLL